MSRDELIAALRSQLSYWVANVQETRVNLLSEVEIEADNQESQAHFLQALAYLDLASASLRLCSLKLK